MNTNIPPESDTLDIPGPVRQAFAERPFLCLTRLARALGWDVATVRGHVERGNLVGRQKGHGKDRTHRVFTLADFSAFWSNLCPSTGTKVHRTGDSTSSLAVIDFRASRTSQKTGPSVKRKNSRRQSVGRPSNLLERIPVMFEHSRRGARSSCILVD
jgi:hypothetical protein